MKTLLAIDAAGRIVLPKPIRRHFHLERGAELEVEIEPHGILLRPREHRVALAEEGGLLVHEGEPTGDLLLAVDVVREKRNRDLAGGLA